MNGEVKFIFGGRVFRRFAVDKGIGDFMVEIIRNALKVLSKILLVLVIRGASFGEGSHESSTRGAADMMGNPFFCWVSKGIVVPSLKERVALSSVVALRACMALIKLATGPVFILISGVWFRHLRMARNCSLMEGYLPRTRERSIRQVKIEAWQKLA